MNTRKLLVSVLMLVSVLLSACASAAAPAPTAIPNYCQPTQEGLTTFSPKTFNLPITLSYGPEWHVAEEYSDVFTLSYIGHDAGVSFMNVKNTKYADGIAFPDDFVTWIQSPDSLFQVVDSKPVLVGGFKGIQINATAACGNTKNWIMLSGTGWGCPGEEPIGFIYLNDVNGAHVLIQVQPSPDGKDYEFIVEESQKVSGHRRVFKTNDILTQDIQTADERQLRFRLEGFGRIFRCVHSQECRTRHGLCLHDSKEHNNRCQHGSLCRRAVSQ